jgi:rhamnosyltransferase
MNFVIIVTYNPNIKQLINICEAINLQNYYIIIVDNTEYNIDYIFLGHINGLNVIKLYRNNGIAFAQNIGINYAIQNNAKAIMFLDQDSKVSANFFTKLFSNIEYGTPNIVAPICFDSDSKMERPTLVLNKIGFPRKVYSEGSKSPYIVDIVISSGTTASIEVFNLAGLFDEQLFIDDVDTEWCLRCRYFGILLRIIPDAMLFQRIGRSTIKLGLLSIDFHGPDRCYYQIRNCFHLLRKIHISYIFALNQLLRTLINRLILIALSQNKRHYITAFFNGFYDGVIGKTGKRPL